MRKNIEKGDLIYGDYVVTELVRENPVYQWVRALERRTGRTVVIQLLRADAPSLPIAALLDYFDAVQGIRRKGLIVPEQAFSDRDYPLLLLYPALTIEPLEAALALAPERATVFWKQASEALFILHNRSLCYGGFTPDSFVLVEGNVCLADFGFAPLIAAGNAAAIDVCRPYLAPEAITRHEVTPAGDLYGLTQRIAEWKPELRGTDWYRQGGHTDPGKRFPDARALYDGFETALKQLRSPVVPPPPVAPVSAPPDYDNHLVPVFPVQEVNVMGYASPAEGGQILGVGRYTVGTTVQVEAKAFQGWRFLEWRGDLSGEQSAQALIAERGKTVVAHFERIRNA